MLAAVCRTLMKSHRVGEGHSKQVVIARGEAFQDVGQFTLRLVAELIQSGHVLAGEDQHFKWPNSPKWDQSGKRIIGADHSSAALIFKSLILAKQTRGILIAELT